MPRTFATALGAFLYAAPVFAQEYPRVELVYQHVPFDMFCEQWRNTKIEQSWKEEVGSKIAAYQEFWNKEAPLLLETVVSEVGKPFQRKEMLAVLTLCPISSMSTPLLIGIGRFLDGPTQGNPRPMFLFSAELFHELLHTYIRPFPPPDSKLMEKYGNEPILVQTHLHLMAVMKQVYLKLGRSEQLKEIMARDSAAPNPAYRRAWQIVIDVEVHQSFVGELRR